MLHDSLLQVRAERVIDHPQDGIELHRRQGLGQVVEGQVNRRIRYALGIDRGGVPGDGQEGEAVTLEYFRRCLSNALDWDSLEASRRDLRILPEVISSGMESKRREVVGRH
jgi:hypothetical protein